MGKPVIASRRGLLPELVEHEECGLVIDDNPEALAQAILRLARDKEMRQRFGQAAAQKAREKFDISFVLIANVFGCQNLKPSFYIREFVLQTSVEC